MKTKKYYVPVIACLIFAICLACFALGRLSVSGKGVKCLSNDAVVSKSANNLQSDRGRRKVNLNLKQETAVKIAEVILSSIYGERVLKQRPWNVTETETDFKIEGTFHGGKRTMGGVAEIVINKSDARVIKYIHGV